jgi:hypothetical protein
MDQPNNSAAAFALNPDDETAAATPIQCSRSETDVKMVDCQKYTSPGNVCIDLTFTRNISVQTLPQVSYFSYHRTVLNKMM